jgi:hypothetical protein
MKGSFWIEKEESKQHQQPGLQRLKTLAMPVVRAATGKLLHARQYFIDEQSIS